MAFTFNPDSEKNLIRQFREQKTLESDIFGIIFREANIFPADKLGKTSQEVIQKYTGIVSKFCNGAKELSKLPFDVYCKFVDELVDSYKNENLKYNGEIKALKKEMMELYDKYVPQKNGTGAGNATGDLTSKMSVGASNYNAVKNWA